MRDDDIEPLTPTERRRRVVLLCCSFMRNLASHRAGGQAKLRDNLLNPNYTPEGDFWIQVHGNFLDTCVLDWCKLFADKDGKHHWRRVVDNPDCFETDLYATLGVTDTEFETQVEAIRHYRDKFVAHLDQERTMFLPTLEVARKAIVFLHERLVQQAPSQEDWRGLPASAEQFERVFTQASEQAKRVYDEALARFAAWWMLP